MQPTESQQPKLSRGGYAIPSKEKLDEIIEFKIEAGRLVFAVMRTEGDTLTKERPIYFTFLGYRDDLTAMAADPAFAAYRIRKITENPDDPTDDQRWPFTLELQVVAIPDDALLKRVEPLHIEKAFEYDVFYDGLGADHVKDGPVTEVDYSKLSTE